MLKGVPEVQVWWARRFKDRRDETLLIRQENSTDKADVIELTLGQVYDLIHAAGLAVMRDLNVHHRFCHRLPSGSGCGCLR
jgi:hypothetical protein